MTFSIPQCHMCAHWVKRTQTCLAFPDKIPDDLYWDRLDHKKPYPGDKGIQFKLRPDLEGYDDDGSQENNHGG